MLQIRLSKGSSGEAGGGSSAKTSLPVETVTVACPDHLVLADLPVAKSLGTVTASAASSVKSVGRRSRRHLGERVRVHFCVRCDFPIAIYGRLVPCEHAFCLACARTDSSCYLCDERIQKIQTIKLMEGIFVCAAPHCLKSFLKRDEFEAHVHEVHADLLHPNLEREAVNETNAFNTMRPSSADAQKQTLLPEISNPRAPPRSAFSPSSSSQHQDHEERSRRHQSRDQSPPRTPIHPKPPPFHNRPQHQPGDLQKEHAPQNWFPQPQSSPNFQQNTEQFSSDKTTIGITPENSYPSFIMPQPPPNYQLPMNANQALVPTPFTYAPFPTDGSQSYYNVPMESGSEQGSVLGHPPVPSFPENFPRPWGMGMIGLPLQNLHMGQGIPEGFGNPADPQTGAAFFQGDYGRRLPEGMMMMNSLTDKEQQQHIPPPPPPPLPLPLNHLQQQQQQQFNRGVEGQVFGWQNDKHGQN